MQHICKICNQELKNAQSLSAHCRTKHKMTSEAVYIEYFLNQFPLDGYLFDFYIPKHNILIEVDGDWFHCNPDVHPEPIYETQKVTLQNDERKNKIVKDNNITLLRFWEKDINENSESIKSQLSQYL